MVKIVPILLGVVVSYAVATALGEVDFSGVAVAPWVGLPVVWDNTVFALFGPQLDGGLATTAIITIMPLAFATMIEHIGDISAIGSTCERNYIADPGLHRTLLGDGLATILASLFGAPANTTYGENTGVLALTRVFDPRVIRIAACCAIVLSFCPKFAAVIAAMPAYAIGGVTISLSGLAAGSLVGIVLNAILPGNDFEFDVSELEEAAEYQLRPAESKNGVHAYARAPFLMRQYPVDAMCHAQVGLGKVIAGVELQRCWDAALDE